jgi:hypothetical protein
MMMLPEQSYSCSAFSAVSIVSEKSIGRCCSTTTIIIIHCHLYEYFLVYHPLCLQKLFEKLCLYSYSSGSGNNFIVLL